LRKAFLFLENSIGEASAAEEEEDDARLRSSSMLAPNSWLDPVAPCSISRTSDLRLAVLVLVLPNNRLLAISDNFCFRREAGTDSF